MKLEGPVCFVEMKLSSVSLDWRKPSLFVKDEAEDFLVWKLGELCTLLLRARFLQALSARKKHSWFATNNLTGTLFLLLRDEVRDLPFLFEAWGEAQISVLQGGRELRPVCLSMRSLPGGALSPFTLARSEIASIFLRLKGDIPRGKGALR